MHTVIAEPIVLLLHLLLLVVTANAYNSYQPRFSVYWNIPSAVCFSQGIVAPLESYGFIVNENHSFYGERIVTLYSNKFGAYPYYGKDGSEYFGGLPQKANLTKHLLKVETDVQKAIPNEDYDGLAIIDYEEWRPLYTMNWGSKLIYQQKSIEYVYNRTGTISKKSANLIANTEFDHSALRFMVATIQLCRKLRPKGKWGFYGFPYCNAEAGLNERTCNQDFQTYNNLLIKLLWYADALYPSIYFSEKSARDYNYFHAAAILSETKRLSLMLQQPKLTYAFTKFEYNSYNEKDPFYKRKDLCASITQSFNFGIDGLIVWSTSNNIQKRCSKLRTFVENVGGPYVQAITTFAEYCSIRQCLGNGRCMLAKVPDKCNDHTLNTNVYQCNCDRNWYDLQCIYYKYKYPVQLSKIPLKKLNAFSSTEYFS